MTQPTQQPAQQPPGTQGTTDSNHARNALIGATVAAVGTFLPWVSADVFGTSISQAGIDGDGIIVLVLSVAAIGTVYLGDWRDRQVTATLGCGVLSVLLAGYYVINISSGSGIDSEMASAAVSPGVGLFVTLAGSLLLSWSAWQRRNWLQEGGTQTHQQPRQTAQQQPTQQSAGQQSAQQPAQQQTQNRPSQQSAGQQPTGQSASQQRTSPSQQGDSQE